MLFKTKHMESGEGTYLCDSLHFSIKYLKKKKKGQLTFVCLNYILYYFILSEQTDVCCIVDLSRRML